MERTSSVTFGDLLRRYRLAAGLTQEELAGKAQVSPRAISDLERGERSRPYRATVQLLAEALQLGPAERAALESAARRAGPPVPDAARGGVGQGSPAPRHNLPVQLTSFVGRERELGELARLLASSRLLTLTGPPGTGKTRLAIELARRVGGSLPDGVVFVPLAPLDRPDLVLPAIRQRLGLRESGQRPPDEALVAYLKSKAILLVLDNFEQVLAAAPLLTDLLPACPEVRLLVTSRGALRVRGEQVFAVAPLAVPGPEDARPGADPEECAAVRLFVERARAVKPDFSPTGHDLRVVGEICRRLDGLPLAIELAAARSAILAPPAMLARLERPLTLLTGGPRDLPARQRTLRAAIAWSYTLLEPIEQRLFRRLAVFVGEWGIAAAAAVCLADEEFVAPGCSPESSTVPDLAPTLDRLESLHRQGLLRLEDRAGLGGDAEPRFGMLETLRGYAEERLVESGEHETFRRRHSAYVLALAEDFGPRVYGPDSKAWLDRLEREHGNARAALRRAEEEGDAETSLRLGAALYRFWWMRDHLREGRQWLSRALAHEAGRRPTDAPGLKLARAQALHAAGILAQSQWDHAAAQPLLEESLAMLRVVGDRRSVANSLHNLAMVVGEQGDFGRAWPLFEESLGLWREVGEAWGITAVLRGMAQLALTQGDYERARGLAEECLALARQVGFTFHITDTLWQLGWVALQQGDSATARARFEESLAIERAQGSQQYIPALLRDLARVALQAGDEVRARSLLVESLAAQGEPGDHLTDVTWTLEVFADLASARGRPARAARLAGAATGLHNAGGTHISPADRARLVRHLETARHSLGDVGASAAWAEGLAMTLERAVAYALEGDGC